MSLNKLPNNKENQKLSFEVMQTPEIIVREERGTQLLSLLLKAENPKWGETKTSLAREIAEYFNRNPLDSEILKIVREFRQQIVDEETFYNIALAYQHPERTEKVMEMIKKYKPHIRNSTDIFQKLLSALESVDKTFSSSSLVDKFNKQIEVDKIKRLELLDETRKRIEKIINFFKPDSQTTDIKKIIFTPTDPLYREDSGIAFSAFPDEYIIISHINNIDNQDHEFCHGIINPIVEKLSQELTDKQKDRISKLASAELKKDYGEDYFSLLCEEFVKTYNNVVKKEERPETYKSFNQKISQATQEQFQNSLSKNEQFRQRCEWLDIATIDDLKEKSKKYFEMFGKNQLRNLLFKLYQEYNNRPNKDADNFEQFILKNFNTKI